MKFSPCIVLSRLFFLCFFALVSAMVNFMCQWDQGMVSNCWTNTSPGDGVRVSVDMINTYNQLT